MSKGNSRIIVANILSALLKDSGSLNTLLRPHKDHQDFGLIQETCYGSCRWYFALEALLDSLLNKPLKKQDRDIHSLLIGALYQLRELDVAEYAVINESVSATTQMKKPWAKGLVNAVLRGYQRRRDELEKKLGAERAIDAFPEWLQTELSRQWPDELSKILKNSNQRPPMTLRVNLLRTSRAEYLQTLSQSGIEASAGELADSAVYLDKAAQVSSLPGFEEGLASVQDEASQLVVPLLALAPQQRVLDACAAPGGKTGHILESEDSLTEHTAIDMGESKLERIRENLDRLQLDAKLVSADASDPSVWWDGNHYDRILLDAPCSATGVIRRHPDIKLLRTPQQIENLTEIQTQLLTALWDCLKPGGRLVYTTCSLLKQENEHIISRFLETTDSAKYEAIAADWGVECVFGRQLLPGTSLGPDGFFYAVLLKTAD